MQKNIEKSNVEILRKFVNRQAHEKTINTCFRLPLC